MHKRVPPCCCKRSPLHCHTPPPAETLVAPDGLRGITLCCRDACSLGTALGVSAGATFEACWRVLAAHAGGGEGFDGDAAQGAARLPGAA